MPAKSPSTPATRSVARLALSAALALTLASWATPAAHAAPITVTEYTTASGSLGGVTFTNQLITLTGTFDSSALNGSRTAANLPVGGLTVTVAQPGGAGLSATFTGSTLSVFVGSTGTPQNPSGLAAFRDNVFGTVLGANSPVYIPYALDTKFGPLAGTAVFSQGISFGTDRGTFVLSAVNDLVVASGTGVVPEPGSLVGLCVGMMVVGGAGMMARRRALVA